MILIANLGNRNLKYEGHDLREYFDARANPQFSQWHVEQEDQHGKKRWVFHFRNLTADLLHRYAEVRDKLSIGILTNLLDTYGVPGDHLTAVYLVITDQPDSHFQQSDTIHAGEIVRRMLREDWDIPEVELIRTQVNPTHEAELFVALAPELRRVVEQHSDTIFRFGDAGGTPQLRSVVRELLRYYVPENRLQIRYSPEASADATHDVDSPFHAKYTLLRVAREFVRKHDYAGTLLVLQQLRREVRVAPALLTLLRIADGRIQFRPATPELLDQAAQLPQVPLVFSEFLAGRAPAGTVAFADLSGEDDRFNLFEIASIAELHLRKKQYALGMLSFIRLLEELGQSVARQHAGPDVLRDRKGFVQRTREAVVANYPMLRKPNDEVPYGLPYLLGYVLTYASPALRQVIADIQPAISHLNGSPDTGINVLRNRTFYTHQSQGVTSESIQLHDRTPPGFLGPNGRAARLFRQLGLPSTSIYDQMNAELLKLLQQE